MQNFLGKLFCLGPYVFEDVESATCACKSPIFAAEILVVGQITIFSNLNIDIFFYMLVV